MYILSSKITIGQYIFNQIIDVEIDSSYENLSDKCTITIPRKLSLKGKPLNIGKDVLFNRGDKVTVEIGYGYSNKKKVFEGYLLTVESGTPTKIVCEDASYLLKRTQPFNLTYPTLSVKQLLADIIPSSIPFKAADIQLGKARFVKMTASQILNYLKNKYSIKSWFRNGTLYVGLNYWQDLQKKCPFKFQYNIISDNLQFVRAEDTLVSVRAISILKNEKRIEEIVGDPDGAERTFHFYDISDSNQLKDRATIELKNLKFDGFTGSITTFGLSPVNHGDIIQLSDPIFPEKNGNYIGKSVKTRFGVSVGYKIEIDLAEKVS